MPCLAVYGDLERLTDVRQIADEGSNVTPWRAVRRRQDYGKSRKKLMVERSINETFFTFDRGLIALHTTSKVGIGVMQQAVQNDNSRQRRKLMGDGMVHPGI